MKVFDADKNRMIELPYVKKCDDMLSRFHAIPERYGRTDGQTDGRTELLYQYRDKNVSVVIRLQLLSLNS